MKALLVSSGIVLVIFLAHYSVPATAQEHCPHCSEMEDDISCCCIYEIFRGTVSCYEIAECPSRIAAKERCCISAEDGSNNIRPCPSEPSPLPEDCHCQNNEVQTVGCCVSPYGTNDFKICFEKDECPYEDIGEESCCVSSGENGLYKIRPCESGSV